MLAAFNRNNLILLKFDIIIRIGYTFPSKPHVWEHQLDSSGYFFYVRAECKTMLSTSLFL